VSRKSLKSFFQAEVLRDLGGVALIAIASLVAALAMNRFSAHPLPIVYQTPEHRFDAELTTLIAAPPFKISPAATVRLPEFRSSAEAKRALILDARPSVFFEQGHVPGALNLARDDFARDYRNYQARGVKFVRQPKEEPYGTVAVFADLYGNLWDLLQMKSGSGAVHRAAARNVEVKARVPDLADVEHRARAFATEGPVDLAQDDTFFACANGRLKLRQFGDGRGELIHYLRADDAGPKTSDYLITPTTAPESLRESLSRAFGAVGRVRKKRRLCIADRTRIHLDQVEDLGSFVELEVVLRDGETAESGTAVARRILALLGIAESQLVRGAYVDIQGNAS